LVGSYQPRAGEKKTPKNTYIFSYLALHKEKYPDGGKIFQKKFQTIFVTVPKLVGSYQPRAGEKKNPKKTLTLTFFHIWPSIEKKISSWGQDCSEKVQTIFVTTH
jgi:hypothetical protein